MLWKDEYEACYNGLLRKGLQLINSPKQYLNCHYFPNSYPKIAAYTLRSIWFEVAEKVDFEELAQKIKVFEGKPVVVKDYVKSEKHYWEQACFIPCASDGEAVEQVTSKFLSLRGSFLNEGLVYREFVALELLTNHPRSGMPLAKEFRLFYVNGGLLAYTPYWNEGEYNEEQPDFDKFNRIASQIECSFFAMDVAKQINGVWIIMELGDGQVSGLPESVNAEEFYQRLKKITDKYTEPEQ
jgi:hypothetical protein